jgi:hypothetical protein
MFCFVEEYLFFSIFISKCYPTFILQFLRAYVQFIYKEYKEGIDLFGSSSCPQNLCSDFETSGQTLTTQVYLPLKNFFITRLYRTRYFVSITDINDAKKDITKIPLYLL